MSETSNPFIVQVKLAEMHRQRDRLSKHYAEAVNLLMPISSFG